MEHTRIIINEIFLQAILQIYDGKLLKQTFWLVKHTYM